MMGDGCVLGEMVGNGRRPDMHIVWHGVFVPVLRISMMVSASENHQFFGWKR